MYLIISKTIFACVIFVLTLITGLAPLRVIKHNSRLLHVSDAFASGIFMGAALLHLLPEAAAKFGNNTLGNGYPPAYLLCIVTFVLLIFIERGIFIYGKIRFNGTKSLAPTMLVLLLATHSLIEGAAIGINSSFFEAITIFIAVFVHKGSESFALAMNLHRFGISIKNIHKIIFLFALMTPLGIFAASIPALQTGSSDILGPTFSSIAAGTFLYLGTEHLIEENKSFEKIDEVIALISGVTLMAIVAIWI